MANKTEDAAKPIGFAEFVATREKCGPLIAAFRFGVSLRGQRRGVFYLPCGIGGHIVHDGEGYKAKFGVWSACAATLEDAETALYELVREHQPGLLTAGSIAAVAESAIRTRDNAEQAAKAKKPRVARA